MGSNQRDSLATLINRSGILALWADFQPSRTAKSVHVHDYVKVGTVVDVDVDVVVESWHRI
jgi:hypothetical protein